MKKQKGLVDQYGNCINPCNEIYIDHSLEKTMRIYSHAYKQATEKTRGFAERLTERIAQTESTLATLKEAKEKIDNCKFKLKDMVYVPKLGPGFIRDFLMYDEYSMDKIIIMDRSAKPGELLADVLFADGSKVVSVDQLMEYNEQSRLLYEQETSQTD